MLPYFLLIFVSALLPFFIYRPIGTPSVNGYGILSQKRNKATLSLFFFGLFLLLALRDITVGIDLIEYKKIFEQCRFLTFGELLDLNWELGYTVFNKLVSLASTDYRVFLIATALFVLIPIYRLYVREKRYSFLLIVLFLNMPCFLMMFSGLRQAIATSIGILAYMAIESKRYVRSVFWIVLATMFHTSAFVLVLLYPAFYLKVRTKHLLFIVPVMIGIYGFRSQFFTFLLNFLPDQYVEFYGEIQRTGAMGMMLLFLVLFVFSFVILDEGAMTGKDYFMRNMLVIATVFQFFVPIHGLVQRASYYFLVFAPVSIVSVVQAPKRYWKNISNLAVFVMSAFFTLYFFYNASFSTDNLLKVFPYKFFWSDRGW